jgi:hypothetical protein
VCSVDGSNRVVALKQGTCTVQADWLISTFYEAASASRTLTIGRGTQSISSTAPSTAQVGTSVNLANLVSVTKSGSAAAGALSYSTSSASSICTVSSAGSITAVGAGTCAVVVDAAQTDHYTAATLVVSLTVSATPVGVSAFEKLTPSRIVDTRSGVGVEKGRVGDGAGGGAPLRVSVLGKGGVPGSVASVGAVSLNVTAVEASAPGSGYVSVYPCGSLPEVSSLNFVSGATVANAVIAPVSSAGEVCVFVYGKADILIDVNAYFGAAVA